MTYDTGLRLDLKIVLTNKYLYTLICYYVLPLHRFTLFQTHLYILVLTSVVFLSFNLILIYIPICTLLLQRSIYLYKPSVLVKIYYSWPGCHILLLSPQRLLNEDVNILNTSNEEKLNTSRQSLRNARVHGTASHSRITPIGSLRMRSFYAGGSDRSQIGGV